MSLTVAAVAVGVLHTLFGPDHYLPLALLAKNRDWGRARMAKVTALCGLAHCLASVVLVVVVMEAFSGLAMVHVVQAWRGDLAAMLLIGLGLTMTGFALRQSSAWRRRAEKARLPGVSGVLLLVFVLGPCEWLVPAALSAGAEHGLGGALLASAAFTAATVSTMLVAVPLAAGLAGRVRLPVAPGAFSGLVVAGCGALMLLGV